MCVLICFALFQDFFPMLFEDPDDDIDNELTDEDRAFLEAEERAYAQNLMDEFNGKNKQPAPK